MDISCYGNMLYSNALFTVQEFSVTLRLGVPPVAILEALYTSFITLHYNVSNLALIYEARM